MLNIRQHLLKLGLDLLEFLPDILCLAVSNEIAEFFNLFSHHFLDVLKFLFVILRDIMYRDAFDTLLHCHYCGLAFRRVQLLIFS